MSIKNEIKKIIIDSLKDIAPDENNVIVEVPKDKKNGDYSSNIALILTKKLKKSPTEIADNIRNNINNDMFESITIAAPGFLNFKISKNYLLNSINRIIDENNNYGKNNIGNNKNINVEFVSANPTGDMHIGHGRGATYGDNLARILNFSGYKVTKEYYINDAGNQMNNLGISIKERYKEICGEAFKIPEDGYHGKEIITIANNIYTEYGNSKLKSEVNFFREKGLIILLEKIKQVLDKYRVNFDIFTSEQSLYDKSLVDETLTKLKNSNKCYINENALWLKTTDYDDEKDRVLIKSDGNYTYLLPDIAYHIDKFNRGFDNIVDVLGSDHHGYIKRLKASLEILNFDSSKVDIKILQMVRLIKNGEELKLSKRTGKTVTLAELIDDIGVNATRYFFSSKSLDTQMDFNLDLAKEESNENPVYYIEYANARVCSILSSYRETIKKCNKYTTINNELTYNIINKLCEFEDVVISSAEKQLPHLIANYAYELASLFHSYYSNEKFIDKEKSIYTQERMALLLAIKIVLNNALHLIGIIPREHM